MIFLGFFLGFLKLLIVRPLIPFMSSENNSLSYDDLIKEKTRLFRNNPTPAENLLTNTLRRIVFLKPLTFNRKKSIGPYIVDFNVTRFNW